MFFLVGIFITKHAMNYNEGRVHCTFSILDRTLVTGYAQKHKKERERNITFKLLNQCEE
jgi:hypothetical protein